MFLPLNGTASIFQDKPVREKEKTISSGQLYTNFNGREILV